MPIPKNVAQDVPFALVSSDDGTALTGASVTVYRSLDGAAQASGSGTVTELGSGQYLFEGLAADFNADYTIGLLFTASGAIPIHVVLQTAYFHKDTAYDIPFLLLNASTGEGLTGASPVGKRCLDGGSQASVSGTFTELGNGQYVFEATAADFGADNIAGFLITATGAVPVHLIIDLLESYTPTDSPTDSPASIIASYLVSQAIVTVPSADSDWPMWISFIADTPDNATGIYNTPSTKDGRILSSGSVIQHYGVEILLRATNEEVGWQKCNTIAGQLDSIDNTQVVGTNNTYTVHNVTRIANINSIGLEQGTKRRNLFSMNFSVSISGL